MRKSKVESIPEVVSLAAPAKRRRKSDDAGEKENALSSKDQKRIQYSLLAQFMSMGEVEFSKWVLSATHAERENVLQQFKKRKKVANG